QQSQQSLENLENLEKPHSTQVQTLSENQALLDEIELTPQASPISTDFILPKLDFLQMPQEERIEIDEEEIDRKINDLLSKLRMFKIEGDIVRTYSGPIVTTFEFRPSPNVKVSRILTLQDDLAMALRAKTIRIQAPVPGKDVVGIEIPNNQIQTIYLREILENELFQNSSSPLTLALGKDIVGNPFVTDLKKLPHLLIAGTTGSGKSVGINAMILSLLYKNSPDTLKLIMIDPKMLEFSIYNDIPHLLTPVITQPKQAIIALDSTVKEMERRYTLMSEARIKNIEGYNKKAEIEGFEPFPYIVVVIDELADLMMSGGKEAELSIARLAQMARASGIHLIVATQRPSVDVVTGTIKANLPSRISYKVGQKIDSKVILDIFGAESLLGRGDMLFTPPGGGIVRLHAPWSTEEEIERIVEFIKSQRPAQYDENFMPNKDENLNLRYEGEIDELYEEAKRIMLADGKTSISYIQRRLGIGYNKAANIVEQMTARGFLSEQNSKGVREIIGE
ncbi:DNA translocase FtsK, partial [Helicobacter pullorum]